MENGKLNSSSFKVFLHNSNIRCLEYDSIHPLGKKIQMTNKLAISKNYDEFFINGVFSKFVSNSPWKLPIELLKR